MQISDEISKEKILFSRTSSIVELKMPSMNVLFPFSTMSCLPGWDEKVAPWDFFHTFHVYGSDTIKSSPSDLVTTHFQASSIPTTGTNTMSPESRAC